MRKSRKDHSSPDSLRSCRKAKEPVRVMRSTMSPGMEWMPPKMPADGYGSAEACGGSRGIGRGGGGPEPLAPLLPEEGAVASLRCLVKGRDRLCPDEQVPTSHRAMPSFRSSRVHRLSVSSAQRMLKG